MWYCNLFLLFLIKVPYLDDLFRLIHTPIQYLEYFNIILFFYISVMNQTYLFYNKEYQWIVDKLDIEVILIDPNNNKESRICKWLIDTWATQTNVSEAIADEMGLKHVWMWKVKNAGWESDVRLFNLLVKLNENFIVKVWVIPDSKIHLQWFDVLIWMDILSLWDFAISRKNWNTFISLCLPTLHTIDFMETYNNIKKSEENIKTQQNNC